MLAPLINFLEHLQQFLDQLGGWAILGFAGIFVVAQLCLMPAAPLALAAGFFFGFGRGWLALSLGCVIGATVNFFIARHFARAWVQRRFAGNEKFQLIDRAIEREGWKIVGLLRFVPIPFGIANYSYGLTPVHYVPYILATFVATLPANCLLVWLGATSQGELATVLGKERPRHPLEYVLLGIGIIAFALALRYLTRLARNAVARGDGPAA